MYINVAPTATSPCVKKQILNEESSDLFSSLEERLTLTDFRWQLSFQVKLL